MAEGVGFEPTDPCGSPVFKTGALNRSAIPPRQSSGQPATHKPFEEYRHAATAKYVTEGAGVNGKRRLYIFLDFLWRWPKPAPNELEDSAQVFNRSGFNPGFNPI
jgi:hypothetical protein